MYMRIVQAKYKPDFLPEIKEIYDNKIIPRLKRTDGCLGVCVIISTIKNDEGISMTLWDSQANAEAYEQSGLYHELLGMVKPFLEDSSEWKIQLSKDLELEYRPAREEPVIKSYTSVSEKGENIPIRDKTHFMHLRIESVKINPGRMEEFRQIYKEEILPAILAVKGCLYAYMTESSEEKDTVLSITIWNNKEDAEAYERSGLFDQLKEKLKHTFFELYQWKMKLEEKSGLKAATSTDMDVKHYSVVTGKSFNK